MSEPRPPAIFEAAYYERLHQIEHRHGWSRGLREAAVVFLRAAGAGEPRTFVDAGCGTGGMLSAARTRLRSRATIGVDLSLEGLKRCRSEGLLQVAAASVDALPIRSGIADVVHSADVLQHLPPQADARFVREAARVLRPGGLLYLRTVARESGDVKGLPGDAHYHQYRLPEIGALCADASLRVEYLTTVNAIAGLKSRLQGRGEGRSVPGIPHAAPAEPLNSLLRLLIATEASFLAWSHWPCPWGRSIVCVARKP